MRRSRGGGAVWSLIFLLATSFCVFFLPSFHEAYTFFTVSCLTSNLVAWYLFGQVLFFFLLGIWARSEWARCSPFILLGIWARLVWARYFRFFCGWCLGQLEMTRFIHLEQLRVGKVFTFFLLGIWARSEWARSGLFNFCLVSEPGRIGPGALLFFFCLVSWAGVAVCKLTVKNMYPPWPK